MKDNVGIYSLLFDATKMCCLSSTFAVLSHPFR